MSRQKSRQAESGAVVIRQAQARVRQVQSGAVSIREPPSGAVVSRQAQSELVEAFHASARCPLQPGNREKAAAGDRRMLRCTCMYDQAQDRHVEQERMLRGAPFAAADPGTLREDVERTFEQLIELGTGADVRDGYRHTFR